MNKVETPSEEIANNSEETQRSNAWLVVVLGALSAFGPLSLDMYLPGLPSLSQDLGGPDWQVQLTLTACLLGLAGGQVIAGPLSDQLGRRRPLLTGLLIYAIASLLCVFAPSVPVLIVLRLVQGMAGSAGIVIARAIVRDLYAGAEAARFFAMTMAVNGLAPILAPVIGGQLLNFTTWRGVFVVLTVIGFGLFLAGLTLPETLPPERRRPGGVGATVQTFGRLLKSLRFVGYAISSGLAFAAMFAYIAGSPFALENIYGVSPQVFSLIFASNALGIIITSQVGGRLVGSGKVNPRQLLALGLISSLTGGILLLVVITTNIGLVGVLPGFFLVVASIGLISPNATALALADYPNIAGSASALIGVLQYVIGALVTPLAGLGGQTTALPIAIIIATLAAAALITFLALTGNPGPKQVG